MCETNTTTTTSTTTGPPPIPAEDLIPTKKGPGILMRTLKKGTGNRFPVKGDYCFIRFQGRLEDGTLVAASQPNQTWKFQLGKRHVLEGIEVAVGHMVQGQTVEATIPHLYAYGQQGHPPQIPPRAVLIFQIELVDISSPSHDSSEDDE